VTTEGSAGIRCVFFDRDGIVNRRPVGRYVTRKDEFHLLPAFVEALEVVREKGYAAVVVTNQSGIERGHMTHETVREIHDHLDGMLRASGLALLDIVVCPSADDGHPDRKPNPGMLLRAAARHGIDLDRSWMVGDQERDVLAGKRAGCRTVLVEGPDESTEAEFRLRDVAELPAFLRQHL
jgi:D-glycero-D-manno-heptose 1,7-bisphosphate phosphatase